MRFLLLCTLILASLTLSACQTAPPSTAAVEMTFGPEWRLIELNGSNVSLEHELTLTLRRGGRVEGYGGVNRFSAVVESADLGRIEFGNIASQRRGGPPEAMARESAYLGMLAEVDGFRVSDVKLELLEGDYVRAIFVR